jgi:hypothetical protein
MPTLVRDKYVEDDIRAERRARGADRWDEVWEGIYVMAPLPNDEHQFLQSRLNTILDVTVGLGGTGEVRAGVNVSDREQDWKENYRCPDVAVFLRGTAARNMRTFWLGGPDFAIRSSVLTTRAATSWISTRASAFVSYSSSIAIRGKWNCIDFRGGHCWKWDVRRI